MGGSIKMRLPNFGRLIPGIIFLALSGAASHQTSDSPSVVWKHHISSRLASPPHLMNDVLWIPLVKGGLEARSVEDGTRIYRLKTRKEIKLFPLSGDSLCAVRFGRNSGLWMLTDDPPRLLKEYDVPAHLVDLAAYGSDLALLIGGPAMVEVRKGIMGPIRPLLLTGTGWSDIHAVGDANDRLDIIVARREGAITRIGTSGSMETTFRLDGGIQSVLNEGDLVFFGRDGMVVRVDRNMNLLWMRDLSSSLQEDPVFVHTEAWIPLRNRTIVRLCAESGNILACYELPGPLSCPPAAVGDDIVFSAEKGILTIIHVTDSGYDTRIDVGDRVAGVTSDGRHLYVTTERGDLICYSLN